MSKEMRQMYQEVLINLMAQDTHVVMLDADLASASGSGGAFKAFPNQTINCGISEANMMSAACGMSRVGLKPFVHTFAPFATRRVFDQLYMSGAFSQNAIHIYGSEPGIWAQFNGGTHTSFEDIALTRTLPNTVVSAPSDEHVFKFILESYYKDHKMYYTRAPRTRLNEIYDEHTSFELGCWMKHGESDTQFIVAMGEMVNVALNVQKSLLERGEIVTIIDAFSIYPYDSELIKKLAKTASKIMVVENHSIYGGLGELVARELVLTGYNNSYIHVGIQHHVSEVGTYDYLAKKFGLDEQTLIERWYAQSSD